MVVETINTKERYEPTLGEVFEVMKEGFERIELHLDKHDQKFAEHDLRFERIDEKFVAVTYRLDTIDESIVEIRQRLGRVEVRLEDVREIAETTTGALDRVLETLFNHEHRITQLEKVG